MSELVIQGGRVLDERDPLLGVEERLALAHRGIHHGHDHLVEEFGRARDDVQVAAGDGIEGSGTDGPAHAMSLVVNA